MDELSEVRICTHYELDGQRIDHPPIGSDATERCQPVYEDMPGWQATTAGHSTLDALPAAAAAYVRRLEVLTGVPVHLISTGPERNQNVVVKDPFS